MSQRVHAVGVIFENEQGQILVLRRHPRDPEGTTWGLVGGKVEGDEDEAAAAKREVQEEIGHNIDLTRLQFVKSYHWERDDLNLDFTVFVLSTQTQSVAMIINQDEHTEYLWATPADLFQRKDLMIGLYPILEDRYGVTAS
jgi:colanic acid biosynthesis protein WcaH